MNPTAELMQVEISGGSTKDGGNRTGSITTGDTPEYPTPLPIFVPVSDFQDDKSNPLEVLVVNSLTAIESDSTTDQQGRAGSLKGPRSRLLCTGVCCTSSEPLLSSFLLATSKPSVPCERQHVSRVRTVDR
jgi:hypothetical protein